MGRHDHQDVNCDKYQTELETKGDRHPKQEMAFTYKHVCTHVHTHTHKANQANIFVWFETFVINKTHSYLAVEFLASLNSHLFNINLDVKT